MNSQLEHWQAPSAAGPLNHRLELPGSKSLTNRELVLAALATSPGRLIRPLRSRDSELMISGLTALGARFEWDGADLTVTPLATSGSASNSAAQSGSIAIDCGLAGTVMRFLPPLAGLVVGEVAFDGDAAARKRPMLTTIDSLRALGLRVEASGDSLPFTVHGTGKILGGELQIDASASSQFVSGLLLSAAKFERGLKLNHVGSELPSQPHIEMTLATLRQRGVRAEATSASSWVVEPGPIAGLDLVIEPDLSNAGPFLAAALVAGGEVTIADWPRVTDQVGREFERILPRMGARVERVGEDLRVTGSGVIHGIDLDLSIGGELAPTIVGLAALAQTPSRITGIAHLRGHETDRLQALENEINALGGSVRQLPDGLEIEPRPLRAGVWHSYEDHRMATTGALIGLRVPGLKVENVQTTAKTMPQFTRLWAELVASSAEGAVKS
jgi:3-phosphoshikimate 1-carboxyvinyltransferase